MYTNFAISRCRGLQEIRKHHYLEGVHFGLQLGVVLLQVFDLPVQLRDAVLVLFLEGGGELLLLLAVLARVLVGASGELTELHIIFEISRRVPLHEMRSTQISTRTYA